MLFHSDLLSYEINNISLASQCPKNYLWMLDRNKYKYKKIQMLGKTLSFIYSSYCSIIIMNNHMSSEQGSNVSNTDDSSYESDENLFNDIMNIADTVEHSMSLKDNSTKDNIIIEDSDVNNSYTDQDIHSDKNNAVKCLEDVDDKDHYHELDNASLTHHEEDSMLSVKNCSTNSNDSFDNEEDELQISNQLELCSNSDSLGSGSAETDSIG